MANTYMKKNIIKQSVQFFTGGSSLTLYRLRKAYQNITQLIWIEKEPIIDIAGDITNEKTPILLFLN